MARFQVDPEILGEAALRLERSRERLTQLADQHVVGNLGDGGLEDEARHTQSRIASQVGQATEGVRGMTQLLRDAGSLYRRGDDVVRGTLTPERAG